MHKKSLIASALVIGTTMSFMTDFTFASPRVVVKSPSTDTQLSHQIETLYEHSSDLNGAQIRITTINRRVILTGQTLTKNQYEQAIILANEVKGVRGINAEGLRVKASRKPLKDTFTTAKVKSSFLKNKFFGDQKIEFWPVTVETRNAIVYLSGKVKTAEERTHLIKLTKKVEGVKAVRSSLTLS